MRRLYSHENKLIVENMRNLLRQEGIEAVMQNEFSGGAIGELSPIETWPELWVRASDFSRAERIVNLLISPTMGKIWRCKRCEEDNEASFEICWNCQWAAPQS